MSETFAMVDVTDFPPPRPGELAEIYARLGQPAMTMTPYWIAVNQERVIGPCDRTMWTTSTWGAVHPSRCTGVEAHIIWVALLAYEAMVLDKDGARERFDSVRAWASLERL